MGRVKKYAKQGKNRKKSRRAEKDHDGSPDEEMQDAFVEKSAALLVPSIARRK